MLKKAKIKKVGIRGKVTLFISLGIFLITVPGVFTTYSLGVKLLKKIIGENRSGIAELMGTYISDSLGKELEHIRAYSASPLWEKQITQANLKYKTMETEALLPYFTDMDKKWLGIKAEDPIFEEYLGNYLSGRLKAIRQVDHDIAEIFVTDKWGGLVAASGKTSDFYQADEDWWQATYSQGQGRDFISNIQLDESSGMWGIDMAVPIWGQSGQMIGVCKATISSRSFFSELEKFRIGKTGHAILTDEKGNIIFHAGMREVGKKFLSDEDVLKFDHGKIGIAILRGLQTFKGSIFLASAPVNSPLLIERGMHWRVFVGQEIGEVFAPVYKFVFFISLLMACLVLLTIAISFLASGRFVKPIVELSRAANYIADRDLDYRIAVTRGDEIGRLADSFNQMAEKLKGSYLALERKVEERTRELNEANEELARKLEELERFNEMTVDRELKMIELKKEIEALKKPRPK